MAETDIGVVSIIPRGEYSDTTVYERLSVVNFEGSAYIALNDNTQNKKPTDENYWYRLVNKPEKGIDYWTQEEIAEVVKEITDNANSIFNKNVEDKTNEFDSHTVDKINEFNTNVQTETEKFNTQVAEQIETSISDVTKQISDVTSAKIEELNEQAQTNTTEFNSNYTEKVESIDTAIENAVSTVEQAETNSISNINTAKEDSITSINSTKTNAVEVVEATKENVIAEINNSATEVNTLKNIVVKEETIKNTSNSLKLEDTANYLKSKIVSIESNKLKQEQRDGYNLLNFDFSKNVINGLTFTPNRKQFT